VSLLEGGPLAAGIRARTATEVAQLATAGVEVCLAAVRATTDPATEWYLRSLLKASAAVGIRMREVELAADDDEGVLAALDRLSADPEVHGIVCLTPLPPGLSLARAGERLTPSKDVDGANPTSLGRLAAAQPAFAPATAQAVIELLRAHGTALAGLEAVVVGRSTVVGKPLALLLLAENATVTVCHSQTSDLAAVTRRAQVLVAAAGRARLIGAGHVRPGAVVIDVGTNPTDEGGLAGDVDTEAVLAVASAVTPVPGGVGPVTTAVLLSNVARAAAGEALAPAAGFPAP
jgi:methylenetetrahydrofolate dehydrogenase (NADP+)/methenyltetrahydrofolate cyclohydrolase